MTPRLPRRSPCAGGQKTLAFAFLSNTGQELMMDGVSEEEAAEKAKVIYSDSGFLWIVGKKSGKQYNMK